MTQDEKEFFESIGVKFDSGLGTRYNTFCCEQGVLISEYLRTKEKIIEFNKTSTEIQKVMVPGLSNEHSGNTFQLSCKFAIAYIPRLIVMDRDRKIDDIIN